MIIYDLFFRTSNGRLANSWDWSRSRVNPRAFAPQSRLHLGLRDLGKGLRVSHPDPGDRPIWSRTSYFYPKKIIINRCPGWNVLNVLNLWPAGLKTLPNSLPKIIPHCDALLETRLPSLWLGSPAGSLGRYQVVGLWAGKWHGWAEIGSARGELHVSTASPIHVLETQLETPPSFHPLHRNAKSQIPRSHETFSSLHQPIPAAKPHRPSP